MSARPGRLAAAKAASKFASYHDDDEDYDEDKEAGKRAAKLTDDEAYGQSPAAKSARAPASALKTTAKKAPAPAELTTEKKAAAKPIDEEAEDDEDDGDDDYDEDDDKDEAPAAGKGAKGGRAAKGGRLAPGTPITIRVSGGRGTKIGVDGAFELQVPAGVGLQVLKKYCRKQFGRYPSHTQGSFTVKATGKDAKKDDLRDGVELVCNYNFAPGNLGALLGGRRRMGFGGGAFGFGRRMAYLPMFW